VPHPVFNEFGHGLPWLVVRRKLRPPVGLPTFRKTIVELPSQLMENWPRAGSAGEACESRDTGEPIPAALIERIRASQTFNQGFETVAYTIVGSDSIWRCICRNDPAGIDICPVEADERERIGVPREVGMAPRLPHFGPYL